MAADEEISISLKADVKQLTDALKSLPDISNREARAMVRGIQREYRKAERAAKRLAESKKVAARSGDGLRKSLLGAEKIAQGFGGTIGGTASMVKNFAEGTLEAVGNLGPLAKGLVVGGGAATGMAAAVGALVLGQVRLADAALEARDRLKESRRFYEIPPEAVESLDRYAAASARLTRELDEASATIGGSVADDVAVFKVRIADLTDQLIKGTTATEGWLRQSLRVASLGVADYFLNQADAAKEATKEQLDQLAAWEDSQRQGKGFLDMLGEMASFNTDLGEGTKAEAEAERKRAEELRKTEKAQREAAQAAREYARAQREAAAEVDAFNKLERDQRERREDATKQLRDIAADLNRSMLTGADAINAAYEEQVARIHEIGAASIDLDARKAALDAAERKRIEELGALYRTQRKEQLEADWEAFEQREQHSLTLMQLEADRYEQAREAAMASVGIASGTVASIESLLTDAADARGEAAKEEGKAARQAAQRMAKNARAAALLGVKVNTAEAIMRGFAMFGPPPSPLGIFAAVNAGAAGIFQEMAIRTSPMPTYFPGVSRVPGTGSSSAGEVPVTMHANEAALNSRAARNLGPQIIDALNAGMEPLQALAALGGGGGGPVILDGMVVGHVMARRVRRPGPLRDAVTGGRPVGYVSPFGRN